jgi:hypothetical protein
VIVRKGRLSRGEVAGMPRLREIDFQRQLVGPKGLATMLGWQHVHFRPAMTKHGWRTAGTGELAQGWPDLVLIRERDHRLIFVELKADGATTTVAQDAVLTALARVAAEVYLWRPRDWPQIEATLR